jgi:putative hemolysin
LNIAECLGLDPAIVAAARKRLGTGAGAADAASVALEAARAQADAADAAAFTAAADLDAARVRAAAAAAAAGAGSFVPVCVVHSVLLLSSLHCIKCPTAFGIDQDTITYLPINFQNCCP